MSDQERWGSQYPQFISGQLRSVTFEKSNRRQKRGQQWRRQTVQGLTSHWGRTDEGKGRGRTYWRARGVLQIEAVIRNGQNLRSQHWNQRREERELHHHQHVCRDTRNRWQACSKFRQWSYGRGQSGYRSEQPQRSWERQQGRNPGPLRTSIFRG